MFISVQVGYRIAKKDGEVGFSIPTFILINTQHIVTISQEEAGIYKTAICLTDNCGFLCTSTIGELESLIRKEKK